MPPGVHSRQRLPFCEGWRRLGLLKLANRHEAGQKSPITPAMSVGTYRFGGRSLAVLEVSDVLGGGGIGERRGGAGGRRAGGADARRHGSVLRDGRGHYA